ncbi:accessory gene regulator B family protein [Alkaliphilus sp. MSJ-5]|uniref:Accessory gene regulator B family protein n=1 Tax=Alkaliphilus flagellatus TaxID=2841507 RepID=A0ABS6G0J2_9FIRM|nr:accessory gene regulator B family protein [Alkaliphilus flagellatus]MBU5676014.1 accessory gene regulator B family protein [Alkaliphilus flagellatus]
MSIEKKLIDGLKNELKLSEDKLEIVTFGYRLLIYSILGYSFIVLVALLFGTLGASLTAAITASLFRIFSGGAHASTQKRCTIIGAVIFNLIGLTATICYNSISLYLINLLFWITAIVALITFILYAPADTPGKPITTKVQRDKLKKISIALLVIWIVLSKFVFKGETNTYKLYLLSSTLGLAWQSVSLWPSTYRWIIFK